MPTNTKYAAFIAQAQEGIEYAIKTKKKRGDGKTEETAPALVELLRKLLQEDDDDEKTE